MVHNATAGGLSSVMSNYPPGVSGNEFEISGAEYEWEEERECEKCERVTWHTMQSHRDRGVWGWCDNCDNEIELDEEEEE